MFRTVSLVGLLILLFTAFSEGQNVSDAEFQKLNTELSQYYKSRDFEKALVAADRIVAIVKERYGKDHPATAVVLRNRGYVEIEKGDVKRAEKTFEEAIDIFKKQKVISKEEGATLAELLEEVGRIRSKEDLYGSEGIFKEALAWREKSNGPDAVETATPLVFLANIGYWKREYKKSAVLYGRALNAIKKSRGFSKEDVDFVYYRAQCTYRKAEIEDDFDKLEKSWPKTPHADVAEKPVTPQRGLVKGGVVNGKALYLERPKFPAEAGLAGVSGRVTIQVLINENGDVISACAVAGFHPSLIEAAEFAAYKSKFSPTKLSGVPVKVSGVITYNFVR